MKKIFKVATVIAVTALTFTGCDNTRVPKANMNNALDSLCYMQGLSRGNKLKNIFFEHSGIDSTNLEYYIQGFLEGAMYPDDKNQNAYCHGYELGKDIVGTFADKIKYSIFGEDSTKTISIENLLAGILKGIKEKNLELTDQEIEAIIAEKDSIIKMDIFRDVREAGMAFLAENAKKEGVNVTESGLQYKIITEGSGQIPAEDSFVDIKYAGKLIDGSVFFGSEGEVHNVLVYNNIPGVKEALMMMPVGSKWEIYIPYHIAYGTKCIMGIKPFSTIIYELELIAIK